MINFTAIIQEFGSKGEKTGWTYVVVPAKLANELKPGFRKSFRVKGKLDSLEISGMALIPMGEGDFILTLKADIRRKLGKRNGDQLKVSLVEDRKPYEINADLMTCLQDEPDAIKYFSSLPASHQRYFSNWVESAKTEPTRVKRITQTVQAMTRKWGFGEMIRAQGDEQF
jgi:tRNA isopentenyl-2-thiomethyl-A-37 hydroxylase MiaE